MATLAAAAGGARPDPRAAWAGKDDFVWRDEPLADAVARAAALRGPRHRRAGAAASTTPTTARRVARRTPCTCWPRRCARASPTSRWAPCATRAPSTRLVRAGVGATVTLPVGGRVRPARHRAHGRAARADRRGARHHRRRVHRSPGPQFTGVRATWGAPSVLDTGARAGGDHRAPAGAAGTSGVFTSVGIDPTAHRYLLLKSRMYFRPVFLPIAGATVYCDGVGRDLVGLDPVPVHRGAPTDLPAGRHRHVRVTSPDSR